MTDSVGRHAAARELPETMIIPPQAASPETAQPGAAGTAGSGAGSAGAGPSGAGTRGSGSKGPGSQGPGTGGQDTRPAGRHASGRTKRTGPPVTAPAPAPAGPPAPAGRDSRLRIVWVYPDLLSTYGDRGNLLVLSRRAGLRGIDVEAVEVNSDQPVPAGGDIYLLGGGEDLPQILAANRLRADAGLARAASGGAVVFAVCAGYQLLGDSFGGVEGEPVPGLGILDISSGRGQRRGVGELVADADPELSVPRLTGFENHQGITRIGSAARPLGRVSLGVGNGDGTEGAYAGKVLGTYMHGPALARNPGLADLLISWVAGRLPPLASADEDWAGQLRAERLTAVGH
jgi:CobQ-like glutamine amidotransferase family enzyme